MVNDDNVPDTHNPNDIRIELVQESDADEVLKLLKKFFFKVN